MAYHYGIDVSQYQGTIDWKAVKSTGKEFAILKVTKKGNVIEPSFERNYLGASAVGLDVGVYRYVYATSVASATAEAEAIIKILNGRKLPVGIWLDMEDSSIKSLGKTKLTQIIDAEANVFKKAGYTVGIYCNKDWYQNVLDSKNLAKRFPFWVARYPSADNGQVVETLNPKSLTNVVAWQYSSKGKVAGIVGNVDLNLSYINIASVMKSTLSNKPDVAKNTIKQSSTYSENAKLLQTDLAYLGYSIKVDGFFGKNSVATLKQWQKDNGLTADGSYGPASYKKMLQLIG